MRNQINVKYVKDYFNSKAVLALGIILIIPVIISQIVSLWMESAFTDILAKIFEEAAKYDSSLETAYRDIFSPDSFRGTDYVSFVFGLMIDLLPVAAWLFIFFSSGSKNPNLTPAAGFIYFTVMSIIYIVGASFITLLGLIFLALIPAFPSDAAVFVAIMGIVVLIAGIILLFSSIFQLKFFGGARKSMKSANMIVTGTGYGVFSVISAVFSFIEVIILAITGMVFIIGQEALQDAMDAAELSEFSFSSVGILILAGAALMIFSGVTAILQAKIAFGYRKMASSAPVQPVNNNYGMPYGESYYQTPNGYNNPQYNSNQYAQPYNQQPAEPASQQDDLNQNPYK